MMKKQVVSRSFKVFACVVLIMNTLFSLAFVAGHFDHDCDGQDCAICEFMDLCLQNLSWKVLPAVFLVTVCETFRYLIKVFIFQMKYLQVNTQIICKTRLNN